MENNLFNELLKRSQNSVSKDMYNLSMYNHIYRQIAVRMKKMYDENQEITNSEIEKSLYNELREYLQVQTNTSIKGNVFRKIIQDRFRVNPFRFEKIYNIAVSEIDEDYEQKVKNSEIHFEYSDYETTEVELVKIYIAILRSLKEKIVMSIFEHQDYSEEEQQKIKDYIEFLANMGTNARSKYLKKLKLYNLEKLDIYPYFKGSEFEQLQYWLKENGLQFEKHIKNKCIESIGATISFLDKYGILDEKIARRKNFFKKISRNTGDKMIKESFADLVYSKDELLELFSKESLEKCSIKQLVALNAEWSNIAIKSINDINKMLFLIKQQCLIENIKKGEKLSLLDSELDESIFKASFEKMYIVRGLIDRIIQKMYKEKLTEYDGSKDAKRMTRSYKNEYTTYFSKYFPNMSNNILDDFEDYESGENIRSNLYKQKDDNMLSLISIFQRDPLQPNWGIVLENDEESIEDEDFVLLSFDVCELIMPIRLHIQKGLLKDYMNNILEVPDIRVYEGSKDFSLDDLRITTNGNCRMNQKYINGLKEITQRINEDDKLYNFIMHLNYIKDYQKYPKSMKKARKQGNKVKYSKIVRYVDFDSEKVISQEEHKRILNSFQSKNDVDGQEV